MHPPTNGILESSLYVDDVARSARFYEQIFGFHVMVDFGERGCAMGAGTRQVLLLFKKGASRTIQSPHDGDGELHLAFAIDTSRRWKAGRPGWPSMGSKWKRTVPGIEAAKVSISEIQTGICWNSPRRALGRSTEVRSQSPRLVQRMGRSSSGTSSVTVKKNVDPMPGMLSSQMRPPISSISRAEIVRPRPVPPNFRVVDPSACVNAWKIASCLSAGIPIPVSCIEN